MASVHVRSARLDDTGSISRLFRSHIPVWQRVNERRQVEDMPYEALTIYGRWLHGGPWMSIETAAIHLSHLLRGAGLALVVETEGQVVAYAEAYHGLEPAPFGDHLHLAQFTLSGDQADSERQDALLAGLVEQAHTARCQRLTATSIGIDPDTSALYRRHGMQPIARVSRLTLPAKSGQGFYKVVEHLSPNPAQIADWHMPIGRLGSARQQWETLWPRTFNGLPEIAGRRTHRLRFSAAGQEAYAYCQEGLYDPRQAEIALWSLRPLTAQLLTALRDWTHREGYRILILPVLDETVKTLGPEAEPDGYFQETYAVELNPL